MIINDLQRLRWQILDECLRDTKIEYFMGSARGDRETEQIKCLLLEVNRRLRKFNRTYKCSKRQLQLDIALFEKRGGRMEPSFRRGHKRILRLANLQWRNPLLRQALQLPNHTNQPYRLASIQDRVGTQTLIIRLSGKVREEIGQEIWTVKTQIDETTERILWAYGSEVEVLYPTWLRQNIAQTMLTMVQRYAKDVPEGICPPTTVMTDAIGVQPNNSKPVIPPVKQKNIITKEKESDMQQPTTLFDFAEQTCKSEVVSNVASQKKVTTKKTIEEKKDKEEGQLNLFADFF